MSPDDLTEFTELLDGTCALLTGGKYSPNDSSTTIFFLALAAHPIGAVRAAFAEHVRRSRFSPTPADILDLLGGSDGRPGAEEAWAIAVTAFDENATVVWTQEMADACALARPIMLLGDEVGARMAFKEAYTRMVAEARQAPGVQCVWSVTEGHDVDGRRVAIDRALTLGRRVQAPEHLLALESPRAALPLLAAPDPATVSEPEAAVRARLSELRDQLAAAKPAPSPDAAAKAQTAEARLATAARAMAYAEEHGLVMSPLPMPVPAAMPGEWREPVGAQA